MSSGWPARAVSATGVALALALCGCAVGPNFHAPPAPGVPDYIRADQAPPAAELAKSAQQTQPGAQLPGEWWQLFHSAPLQEVVQQGLAGSPTLAAADATLAEAREEVAVARGALFPRIQVGAAVQHTSSTSPGAQPPNEYTLGPSASYALDVFGGARRGVEQQSALAQQQRYQLAAAYLTLTGGIVNEALSIAATRLQLSTTEELIESDRKNLALTEREFEVGTAARTDVLTADSQLASDLTQLPTLRQQLSQARDALAVLLGQAPAQAHLHDFDIKEFTAPAQIPLSLPSLLVRQRPDILSAEAQLHADSAAIGVAVAQEFPTLTLSAAITRSALQAGDLFHQFDTLRSAGGTLAAPIFAGGALRAQARAARDAFRAQLDTYRATVIEALGQVTDDLWALEYDAERLEVDRHAVDIASEALKLQQASYAVGRTNVLQLIDAERTYAQQRLALVTAQIQQLQDSAGLVVALGGAWWQDAADPAAHGD
jgi:NodT family efflux transporter outer membrane factor (OMF) lipoprotein